MEYEQGKIYLRNVKNGRVYQYERNLARHKDIEAFVPNPMSVESESKEDKKESKTEGGKEPQKTGETQQSGPEQK